jgi:hypothetical protein
MAQQKVKKKRNADAYGDGWEFLIITVRKPTLNGLGPVSLVNSGPILVFLKHRRRQAVGNTAAPPATEMEQG